MEEIKSDDCTDMLADLHQCCWYMAQAGCLMMRFNSLFSFRSVTYSVNNFHKDHVTVLAEVVPVDIELSTEELVLKPSFGLPADAG